MAEEMALPDLSL